MCFKDEVCMWFQKNEPHHRLELLCGLLNMCVPLELRFISTCVEDLSKKHDFMREAENKSNSQQELEGFISKNTLLDNRTRSNLIVYIAVLKGTNKACSCLLYDLLMETESKVTSPSADLIRDILIICTMILHHPAFTFQQKKTVGELLCRYQNLEAEMMQQNQVNKDSIHSCSTEACDSGLSVGTEPEVDSSSELQSVAADDSCQCHLISTNLKKADCKSSGSKSTKSVLTLTSVSGTTTSMSPEMVASVPSVAACEESKKRVLPLNEPDESNEQYSDDNTVSTTIIYNSGYNRTLDFSIDQSQSYSYPQPELLGYPDNVDTCGLRVIPSETSSRMSSSPLCHTSTTTSIATTAAEMSSQPPTTCVSATLKSSSRTSAKHISSNFNTPLCQAPVVTSSCLFNHVIYGKPPAASSRIGAKYVDRNGINNNRPRVPVSPVDCDIQKVVLPVSTNTCCRQASPTVSTGSTPMPILVSSSLATCVTHKPNLNQGSLPNTKETVIVPAGLPVSAGSESGSCQSMNDPSFGVHCCGTYHFQVPNSSNSTAKLQPCSDKTSDPAESVTVGGMTRVSSVNLKIPQADGMLSPTDDSKVAQNCMQDTNEDLENSSCGKEHMAQPTFYVSNNVSSRRNILTYSKVAVSCKSSTSNCSVTVSTVAASITFSTASVSMRGLGASVANPHLAFPTPSVSHVPNMAQQCVTILPSHSAAVSCGLPSGMQLSSAPSTAPVTYTNSNSWPYQPPPSLPLSSPNLTTSHRTPLPHFRTASEGSHASPQPSQSLPITSNGNWIPMYPSICSSATNNSGAVIPNAAYGQPYPYVIHQNARHQSSLAIMTHGLTPITSLRSLPLSFLGNMRAGSCSSSSSSSSSGGGRSHRGTSYNGQVKSSSRSSDSSPSRSQFSSPRQSPSPENRQSESRVSSKGKSVEEEENWEADTLSVVVSGEEGSSPPPLAPCYNGIHGSRNINSQCQYFMGVPSHYLRYPSPGSTVVVGSHSSHSLNGGKSSQESSGTPNTPVMTSQSLERDDKNITHTVSRPGVCQNNSASGVVAAHMDALGHPIVSPPVVNSSASGSVLSGIPPYTPTAYRMAVPSVMVHPFSSPPMPGTFVQSRFSPAISPPEYFYNGTYPSGVPGSSGSGIPGSVTGVGGYAGSASPYIPGHLTSSKKGVMCYNCGNMGHRGAECQEASLEEITKRTKGS